MHVPVRVIAKGKHRGGVAWFCVIGSVAATVSLRLPLSALVLYIALRDIAFVAGVEAGGWLGLSAGRRGPAADEIQVCGACAAARPPEI